MRLEGWATTMPYPTLRDGPAGLLRVRSGPYQQSMKAGTSSCTAREPRRWHRCLGDASGIGDRDVLLRAQPGDAELDRRHEPIATADDCSDVDRLLGRVAQRAPEIGHVDLEVALMNEQPWPTCRDQFVPRDQFASAFNQRAEDRKGPRAEAERSAIAQDQVARGDQSERPEREHSIRTVEQRALPTGVG